MSLSHRVGRLERAAGLDPARGRECVCTPQRIYILGTPDPIPGSGPCPRCGLWRETIVVTGANGEPLPGMHRLPSRPRLDMCGG